MTAAEALILAKSIALIEKTKQRVAQIDSSNFPTESSTVARTLLRNTLDVLGNNAVSPAVSPEALYNALIRFQRLVEDVEMSTSEHVSWPLVSYCDHVWLSLFPHGDSQIFYSVTSEHNYSISSFSSRLATLLQPVLASAEIDSLVGKNTLYCLQLASLEEENLPLYANIGHEFGHAVWWGNEKGNEKELLKFFVTELKPVFGGVQTELQAFDMFAAARRTMRAAWIIKSIATELFCDLIGLIVSGPAFLLSLNEMSWGSDETRWTGRLVPHKAYITAYPSFRFRLHCLKRDSSVPKYEADAAKSFKNLGNEDLKKLASYLSELSSDHRLDSITVTPDSDPDRAAIEAALSNNLPALKTALERFLDRCDKEFLPALRSKPEFAPVSTDDVAALLLRLQHDILPNIIPDESLLGAPASFSAILNASALYRIAVLRRSAASVGAGKIFGDLEKIERLTDKAMEVSYVQRDFQKWKDEPT